MDDLIRPNRLREYVVAGLQIQGVETPEEKADSTSCLKVRRTKLTRSYPIDCFVAVFSTRELRHDDAPSARSMPAWGNAPGTCPLHVPPCKGGGFLRPCRADRWIPKPRALPWAGLRRRFQRRRQRWAKPHSRGI